MQMIIKITFTDFSTETCCDHVRIYDGYSYRFYALAELSGTDVDVSGMSFISTQQFVYIYFTSDHYGVSRGFSATFESIRKEILM